jgi:hypothetical protein
MPEDADLLGGERRIETEFVRTIGGDTPPFERDDLRVACRKIYPDDTEYADQISTALLRDYGGPGVIWDGDITLWVALLSDEHAERIRGYLGWTPVRMVEEIARVRSQYGV